MNGITSAQMFRSRSVDSDLERSGLIRFEMEIVK